MMNGYISEEKWKRQFKKMQAPDVHSSTIYNSQDMEAT